MSLLFTSGTWTSAAAIGALRYESPFAEQRDTASYILRQDFAQFAANFSPIASGTVHPTVSDFYLIGESAHEDIGGGAIKWTRTYAKKPAQRNEPAVVTCEFPGYAGIVTVRGTVFETVTGRDPETLSVPARVQFDYYRIAASGGDYTAFTAIPILAAQAYLEATGSTIKTKWLRDSPPWSVATSPTLTAYLALISGGTEIVAQDSVVEQWLGPYYVRRTIYVVAR